MNRVADLPAGSRWRTALWLLPLLTPLGGLWLLIARPALDVQWEHHPSHFWLVLGVAMINVAVGLGMSEQTRRRADARLFLVSMAFLASAGFLALHALATPAVLVGQNTGFVIATPVGLLLAAVFAAISSFELGGSASGTTARWQGAVRAGLLIVLLVWAAATVLEVPPLDRPIGPTEAQGPLRGLAVIGTVLYGVAGWRYWLVHRRRPSAVLVAVITAFVLLAESMIAIGVARNWHASWWEWHLLMAVAFGFVAYSTHLQHAREGSRLGLFNSITLERTIRAIQAEHGEALEALVGAMRRQEETGELQPIAAIAARVGSRFGLTERQVEVLERAAQALATEREQVQQLGALVAVGKEASVVRDERDLIERATSLTAAAFPKDEIRIRLHDGAEPGVRSESEPTVALPLVVNEHDVGVIEVWRSRGALGDHDRFVLQSLANQLSIAVENARLYRRIENLFRQYMSPDVAATLLADPDQASLGGSVTEVTVLMADLRGFTPFSERTSPSEVATMLNEFWAISVPVVLAHGGTVVQFIGDALMALFNAPTPLADHARRAASAALEMQRATGEVAEQHPGWPRFRVGINTGPALVGNVGSEEFRNFTAIGDTTNLAARLESIADVGQVVIGPVTRRMLGDEAIVDSLGPMQLKGKAAPVEAFALRGLRDA